MSSQTNRAVSLLVIVSMFISLGCMAVTRLISNAPSTPTPAPAPVVSKNTPVPTKVNLSSCTADQALANLKSVVKYSESAVLYNKVKDTTYLIVWFVDPDLNPGAKQSELAKNAELAVHHALILSQELKASDPCVVKLFDVINAIVVDKSYHGWLSAQINITDLPAAVQTDSSQLDKLAKLYQIQYLRNKVAAKTGSASAGSCAWREAGKNIRNHFSSERENVAFYFVLDETGVNVYAQWDGKPDFAKATLPAALMNIAMEIDCLAPEPDRIIFNIVDETGEMQIIGLWNGSDARSQDIGKIKILYQK